MQFSRMMSCLTEDAARMARAAEGRMDATVPTCPAWTMTNLIEHVAHVYMHKTECVRNGRPENWPPPRDPDVTALTLMRQGLGDLLAELTPREPADTVYTWYDPDQSIGFWIRRMAQETVIHRVDAELAAGVTVSPIDAELALDGIDELLRIFIGWSSHKWADGVADSVTRLLPKPVAVVSGDSTWVLRPVDGSIDVDTEVGTDVAVTISGEPVALLLWLWRRGDAEAIEFDGDEKAASSLHELIEEFTQ